jgi:hypothetical protein
VLGLKFIVSGVLLLVISSIFMRAIGKYPGPAVGAPLILTWVGGVLMLLYGAFAAIWL